MNIDQVYDTVRAIAGRIDAKGFEPQPWVCELVIAGENGGVFSAEVNHDRISLERGARADAACSINASADTLAAMLSGKLKPMQAVMLGRVKIRGDIGAVMRFAALLK